MAGEPGALAGVVGALHVATALLFVSAAVPKLRSSLAFAGVVANYRLLPGGIAGPFARVLPNAELVLAIALVVPGFARVGAMASAVLLVAFAAAMGINIARGRSEIDCGCRGGEMRQPLRRAMVWRNLVWGALLACSAAAAGVPGTGYGTASLALSLVAGGAFFLLHHIIEQLWAIPAAARNRMARG